MTNYQRVADLMTRGVISVGKHAPLLDAVKYMHANRIRHIVVTEENKKPIGIVSIKDVSRSVVKGYKSDGARGILANLEAEVGNFMSEDLASVGEDELISKALSVMTLRKIGALLVVDGELKGILTERDCLKLLRDYVLPYRVWEVMSRELIEAKSDEELLAALERMTNAGVRHLPVLTDKTLSGLLCMRDIVDLIPRENTLNSLRKGELGPLSMRVGDLMVRDPCITDPNTSLHEVADVMRNRVIGALPVSSEGRIVGIITERDVLRALAIELSGQNL